MENHVLFLTYITISNRKTNNKNKALLMRIEYKILKHKKRKEH